MAFNKRGVTFAQWFYTAIFGRTNPLPMDIARNAWRLGLDPTAFACW